MFFLFILCFIALLAFIVYKEQSNINLSDIIKDLNPTKYFYCEIFSIYFVSLFIIFYNRKAIYECAIANIMFIEFFNLFYFFLKYKKL